MLGAAAPRKRGQIAAISALVSIAAEFPLAECQTLAISQNAQPGYGAAIGVIGLRI